MSRRSRPARSSSRSTSSEVERPGGRDDPRRLRAARHRHADALLRRDAAPDQRLPRLRRRDRGRPRAGAGVLAQGRARHGRAHRLRARPPEPPDGAGVPGLLGRPLHRPGRAALRRSATTPSPSATGRRPRRPPGATARAPATTRSPTARPPRRSRSRRRSTTTSTCATTASASSVTSASTRAASSAQNTFAITVAGRGFDARISTEYAKPLPQSACVYCGNCIAVCPTGALMFESEHELREAGDWDESRQTDDGHDLPLLRRRLHPHAARAGQQDRQGHARRPTTTSRAATSASRAASASST